MVTGVSTRSLRDLLDQRRAWVVERRVVELVETTVVTGVSTRSLRDLLDHRRSLRDLLDHQMSLRDLLLGSSLSRSISGG